MQYKMILVFALFAAVAANGGGPVRYSNDGSADTTNDNFSALQAAVGDPDAQQLPALPKGARDKVRVSKQSAGETTDRKTLSGKASSPRALADAPYNQTAGARPANDLCTNAIPVAVPSSTLGTTDDASADLGFPTPCCNDAGIDAPGVWYKVVGTGNAISATTCNAATVFDTQLTVYSPDCATPSCVTGNDDACGLSDHQSLVAWCSEPGQTYLILVHGFDSSDFGPFQLDVADTGVACLPTGPCGVGDSCSSAVPVAVPSSTTGTTVGAAVNIGFPTPCGGDVGITAPGVWYSVTGTGNTMSATTCNAFTDGSFDTQLTVYCPDCATAACVTGNDDDCGIDGGLSTVSWCSEPGRTYLILVHGFDNTEFGPFQLDVADDGTACLTPAACERLPGDDCTDAVPVTVPSSTTGTTRGASADLGFPSPCGDDAGISAPGVWYTVVGTGQTMSATTCNAATRFDNQLTVYCPDCDTPVCVTGNDDDDECGIDNSFSSISWCSHLGQTYLILVHGFDNLDFGRFQLDVADDGAACESPASCTAPTGPVFSDTRVSASKKGSLLFFSKIELKWAAAPAPAPPGTFNLTQDTFLTIVNDWPADVYVQWYFINGDAPLAPQFTGSPPVLVERGHPGWNWRDCNTFLTHNESTYMSAATGNPLGCQPFRSLDDGLPPGRPDPEGPPGSRILRGYAIAFAVDNQGHEISWNHLSGSADIVNYTDRSAWEYNTYAAQCLFSASEGTACGASPGTLQLDGSEYDSAYDRLLFDFYAVGSRAFTRNLDVVTLDTDLTLYPVDVDLRQDNDGPITTKAKFDIWNQNEDGFSGTTRCITCWDQTLLSSYGALSNFMLGVLHTDKGKARIEGQQSDVCDPPGSCCNLSTDIDCFPAADHPLIDSDCSVKAALLGVSDKILAFSGAGGTGRTDAGMTLVGQGTYPASIQRDIIAPPDPLSTGAEEQIVPVEEDVETSVISPRSLSDRPRKGKD